MRTRREFLITAGRLGLGAAGVAAVGSRPRESVAAGAPRTIRLAARAVKLVLDDWAAGTGRPVPPTDAGTAGARGSAGGMMGGMMSGGRMGGMMGGRGMGGMMGGGRGMGGTTRDETEPAYDVMTIN